MGTRWSLVMALGVALAGRAAAQPAHGPALFREEANRAYEQTRRAGEALFQSNQPPLSGNGRSCTSCHDRGRSLEGVFGRYPRYDKTVGRLIPLEEQIHRCIASRMAGDPPVPGSPTSVALLVHLKEEFPVPTRDANGDLKADVRLDPDADLPRPQGD